MRSFRSDNNAGLCPEALDAIVEANRGHAVAYSDDEWTATAVAAFESVFGTDIVVRFVATGTAANTLAIASMTQPWQQVICHGDSHYNDDESTAPERITHCRMCPVYTALSKLTPDEVCRAAQRSRGDVHQPQPGVVTLSNSTELGTVYTPDELRSLSALAHEFGYLVHIDGARFANAVASIRCDPRDLSADAGVDALSFGGTKNGLACGEAVVFFGVGENERVKAATECFDFHRKGTGHLVSKHRFIAAPFAATLKNGAWLKHAGHANAMARRLADGIAREGLRIVHPCEANAVFVQLPDAAALQLEQRGHGFYPFGQADAHTYRLMCSFDTTIEDIDSFLEHVREIVSR